MQETEIILDLVPESRDHVNDMQKWNAKYKIIISVSQ